MGRARNPPPLVGPAACLEFVQRNQRPHLRPEPQPKIQLCVRAEPRLAAYATPKVVTAVAIETTSRPIGFIRVRCSDSRLSAQNTPPRGRQRKSPEDDGKRASNWILDAAVTGASVRLPRRERAQFCFASMVDGSSRLRFRSFLQSMVARNDQAKDLSGSARVHRFWSILPDF